MVRSNCMICIMRYLCDHLPKNLDEKDRTDYLRTCFRILADVSDSSNGSIECARLEQIFKDRFHTSIDMSKEKKEFNDIMLDLYPSLKEMLKGCQDPILDALELTLVGNYIDFGTLIDISKDKLMDLMDHRKQYNIDPDILLDFKNDLSKASSLVYLADNCGEIVMDKLLLETIHRLFPHIRLTVIVRGAPVINDVTMEDALYVGIDSVAGIISNGTSLPGTELTMVSNEAKDTIMSADLIISKGLGNLESMSGCGLNVYYLFLNKCAEVERLFLLKPLEGIMVRENNNAFAIEAKRTL